MMCIIAIKPKNKPMFSEITLRTMFFNNPDGCGLMYYDEELKKVVIKKGYMTYADLKKELSTHDYSSTNLVLHFRISTSGLVSKSNCHPYPIYGGNNIECVTNLAMAHNGVLGGYIPYVGARYNDTQLFIWRYLQKLERNFINHEDTLQEIAEHIGTHNKLAFLDNKNRVTLIGKFIEDNGYYFSNTSYKFSKYYYSTKAYEERY